MQTDRPNISLRQAIGRRVLLLDGSMGTELRRTCGGSGCCDLFALTRPEAVAAVHRAYLDAGADIIETDTFNATTVGLQPYGLADRADSINRAAVVLGRLEADRYMAAHPGSVRYVAGAVGPTHLALSAMGEGRADAFSRLRDTFRRQAAVLIDAGVDMLMIESVYDLNSGLAAVSGVTEAIAASSVDTPYTLSVTLSSTTGLMPSGHTMDQFLDAMPDARPLAVGFNCCEGPEMLLEPLRRLAERHIPLIAYPNAGLPDPAGHYPYTPAAFTTAMSKLLDTVPLAILGGCCGTTPAHIRHQRTHIDTRACSATSSSP